jgi:hypothetical protein
VKGKALINAPYGANTTPAVQIGAVSSPYASGSDVTVSFFVPKLATTGPLTVIGYNRQLVTSSTPFRIVPPAPTAYYQDGATAAQAGMKVRFIGRLAEVTKISFTGGVELTTGWTASPIYNDGSCQDLLEVAIPQGAKSGPVTFTNPRGTATASVWIVP